MRKKSGSRGDWQDLDAADPYAYGSQLHSPPAAHLNPFTDPTPGRYSPLSSVDDQERVQVENYLLQGRQQSPVHVAAPPLPPASTVSQGNFYPTNASGQPLSSLEAQNAAAEAEKQEKSRSFNFFAGFGRSRRSSSNANQSFTEKSGYEQLGDENDEVQQHFGPAPLGPQTRRNKMKKRVALTEGNLVLDCPIPSRLDGFLPRKDAEEFKYMRYSAVTCDVRASEANENIALTPSRSAGRL